MGTPGSGRMHGRALTRGKSGRNRYILWAFPVRYCPSSPVCHCEPVLRLAWQSVPPPCHPERAKASRRIFTSRFYCAVGKCKDSSTSLPTVVSLRMTASGRHSGFCFFKSSRRDTTIVNCQFSIVNSRKSAFPNHGTAASKNRHDLFWPCRKIHLLSAISCICP